MALPPEGPRIGRAHELAVVLTGLSPKGREPGLLIYAQGRTGSTLLGQLLASHGQVEFGDEVLRGPVRRPLRYLDGLRARAAPRLLCVHVKPYHLTSSQGVSDRRAWLGNATERGWRLLHLRRRDLLRQALSNMTITVTGSTHRRQGEELAVPRLDVDVDELMRLLAARQAYSDQEDLDLRGLPHTSVEYERDLLPGPTAWTSVCHEVFGELGLPLRPVSSTLRRTGTRPLEELVANVAEVRAAIEGSRWAGLLQDG